MRVIATIAVTVFLLVASAGQADGRTIGERTRETELSSVEYRDARVDEAFESLSDASRATDPDGVGINIIYRGPEGEAAPRITLTLRRVSLYDAIRYITEVSGLYYRLDDNAVIITPEEARGQRIETRMYPVQPSILDVIRGEEREVERDWFF